jgi:hypothetical protein
MTIKLTKNDFGLLPGEFDQQAIEFYSSIPMGAEIEVKITIPRDIVTHKRYFKVVSLAYYHLPEVESRKYADMTEFRKMMEMSIGYADIAFVDRSAYVISDKGVTGVSVRTTELRPKSVSFAEMDEDSFQDLYKKMKKHLSTIFSEWGYDTKFLILQ